MGNKLWTLHFVRICLANLLLFVSLYMLYPVLPVVMAGRLGVPISQTGIIYVLFALAMLLIGPFHNYLIDVYKRKYVCILSLGVMIAATAGLSLVRDMTQLLLLCVVQGISFGLTTTAGITLAIDITTTTSRSAGNILFSWAARLGMLIGIALGVMAYRMHGFESVLYLSVAIGGVALLVIAGVYVPFRAPIATKVCSCDRFLLLRGWVPALNLMMIAFIPGMLLPMLLQSPTDVFLSGVPVPFFALAGAGFLLTAVLVRFFFRGNNKLWLQTVLGLILMMVAIGSMSRIMFPQVTELLLAAVLFGLSLALIAPEFLLMFVRLSEHCQRGTANTTHLLAWELGIAMGIATACSMDVTASREAVYQLGMLSTIVALIFFVLITYPYYKKKRIR